MIAQDVDSLVADTSFYIVYVPRYEVSIGVEHSNVPAIFLSNAYIPDNYEVEWRVKNRTYMQAGLFAVSASDVPGEYFFTNGFGVYTGASLKLFLFKNAYFNATWNLIYDQYGKSDSVHNWSISTGPTAAFEYFVTDRFSLRLDAFNVNIAVGSPEGFSHIFYTVHRLLGLGVRYNFDVGRGN